MAKRGRPRKPIPANRSLIVLRQFFPTNTAERIETQYFDEEPNFLEYDPQDRWRSSSKDEPSFAPIFELLAERSPASPRGLFEKFIDVLEFVAGIIVEIAIIGCWLCLLLVFSVCAMVAIRYPLGVLYWHDVVSEPRFDGGWIVCAGITAWYLYMSSLIVFDFWRERR